MSRYSNIKRYKRRSTSTTQGKVFRGTTTYPIIPLSSTDIYLITVDGDRLDLLADQYYGNKDLWWIISSANVDLPQNSLYIPNGTQLRIPIEVNNILASYDILNKK